MLTEAPPSLLTATQSVLEDASVIQESNRNPNVYAYINKNGKVYTPEGALISKDIKRDTYVRKLEAQAYDELERKSQKAATLVWVSPAQFGVYEVSKIIITEVVEQGDYSVLLNRAVVLDKVNSEKALKIAQLLVKGSTNNPKLRTVDDVRENIITLNPRQKYWLDVLEELAPDPQWEMIRSGQDIELEEQALANARLVHESKVKEEENGPRIDDYRGGNSLSCPEGSKSAFEAFWGTSNGSEGCNRIKCGRCSWVANEGEVKKIQAGSLKSCPDCGWKP